MKQVKEKSERKKAMAEEKEKKKILRETRRLAKLKAKEATKKRNESKYIDDNICFKRNTYSMHEQWQLASSYTYIILFVIWEHDFIF